MFLLPVRSQKLSKHISKTVQNRLPEASYNFSLVFPGPGPPKNVKTLAQWRILGEGRRHGRALGELKLAVSYHLTRRASPVFLFSTTVEHLVFVRMMLETAGMNTFSDCPGSRADTSDLWWLWKSGVELDGSDEVDSLYQLNVGLVGINQVASLSILKISHVHKHGQHDPTCLGIFGLLVFLSSPTRPLWIPKVRALADLAAVSYRRKRGEAQLHTCID